MTVLLLIRLAVAVLVILMCSWAMAVAWAAGGQGTAVRSVQSPTIVPEMSIGRMPDVALGTGAEG
jgi:hypothetical protein